MNPFPRRRYSHPGSLVKDLLALIKHRRAMKRARGEMAISAAFRERLMMVVTDVNDCRYCRRFHQAIADKTGVTGRELYVINQGLIPEDAPPRELPALRYARAWAEADAMPGQVWIQALEDHYSPAEVESIHGMLYMIRIGNLVGNTFDFVLYQLSRGRWGRTRRTETVLNPAPDHEERA